MASSERLNILLTLKSAVQEGQKTLGWLKSFTGMISGAGGALAMFAAKQSLAFGANIQALAAQAQMGAVALQTLALEGEISNLVVEDISRSHIQLRKNLQDARGGAKGMADALKVLNLSAAGMQALAPERQWEAIGLALNSATDRQAALNAVSDLFGTKNGPKLASILKTLGAEGYDKVAQSVEKIVLTKEQIDRLEAAANAWARIQSGIKLAAAHATNYTIEAFTPNSGIVTARNELARYREIEQQAELSGQKLSDVMVESIRVARVRFIEELVKVGGDQILLAEDEIEKLRKMQKAAAPVRMPPTLTSAETGYSDSYYGGGVPGIAAPKKTAAPAPAADPLAEAVERMTQLIAKRREDDAAAAADAARRQKELAAQQAAAQKIAEAEDRTKKLREEGVKAAEAIKKHTFDQATATGQLVKKQGELADLLKKYEEETEALMEDGSVTPEDLANREKIFLAKRLELMGELLGIQKKLTAEAEKEAGIQFTRDMDSLASGRAQVDGNPFMTSRGKAALRVQSYQQENTRIADELARIDAAKSDPAVDQNANETRRNELIKRRDGNALQIQANTPLDAFGELRKQLVDINDQLGSTEQMMGRAFGGIMQGNIDVLAGGIRGLIDGTMTWSDALQHIGTGIINNVIDAISKMFAEWITSRLTASAVSQAASVEEGATDLAAKAPGALMTSITTFGIAAALGIAAMVAAMAMFDTGGYTGAGNRYQPAGLVHKGEVVLEKPLVDGQVGEVMSLRAALQAGVPARDLLSGLAGYAGGGYAGNGIDFRPVIVGAAGGRGGAAGGRREKPVRNIFTDSRRMADELAQDPAFDNRIVNLMTKKRRRAGYPS
ncbi:hypothetical protein OpiT1DRAFT_00213 [Opitutaceae bacterium TAV1]|nr:hypothetical protein OpiT1DRAFT_00213 [Opitutaceae bacterium TAV1]